MMVVVKQEDEEEEEEDDIIRGNGAGLANTLEAWDTTCVPREQPVLHWRNKHGMTVEIGNEITHVLEGSVYTIPCLWHVLIGKGHPGRNGNVWSNFPLRTNDLTEI